MPAAARQSTVRDTVSLLSTNERFMIDLGVNIDHVATLRQQRLTRYPDPISAALRAEDAGADLITLHLREDRRHIQEP